MISDAAVDNRSIGELIRELKDDAVQLLRDEIALATTELKQSATRTMRSMLLIAVGVILGMVALLFLSAAAAIALAVVVQPAVPPAIAWWAAPLAVCLAQAFAAWACISYGRKRLERDPFVMPRTSQRMKETSQWAKEQWTRET